MKFNRQSGFTLTELMITVSLAAILLAAGVAGFTTLVKSNRTVAQANTLLSSINLARTEATKRGINVVVCSSIDQATCAASTNWATGWIVFVDQNKNGTFEDTSPAVLCQVDAGGLASEDCLLRVYEKLKGKITLVGAANNVQYLPTGVISAGTSTITLTPSPCKGKQKRILKISKVGRAGITDVSCP